MFKETSPLSSPILIFAQAPTPTRRATHEAYQVIFGVPILGENVKQMLGGGGGGATRGFGPH